MVACSCREECELLYDGFLTKLRGKLTDFII